MALTRRQKELMDFLSEFIRKNGYSPSYEEIASGLNLASLATVHKHIQALQAKSYLRRSFNHSRSLEIGSFACRSRYARRARSRCRPRRMVRPSSTTANGPRTRNSTGMWLFYHCPVRPPRARLDRG